MKKIIGCAALLLLSTVSFANEPSSSLQGKPLGISETDKVVSKTTVDSSGFQEVLKVFKNPQSKLSWQIENKDSKGKVSSKLQKFRDGSQINENFGADGKLVSRVRTDSNGNSKIKHF